MRFNRVKTGDQEIMVLERIISFRSHFGDRQTVAIPCGVRFRIGWDNFSKSHEFDCMEGCFRRLGKRQVRRNGNARSATMRK